MTRRSRRNRPPRLEAHAPLFVDVEADNERPIHLPTPRAQVIAMRIAGQHATVGRSEIEHLVGRLSSGEPEVGLGCYLESVSRNEARAALHEIWGWDGQTARASIDPDCTLDALAFARDRIAQVATAGGRVALATGRPASFLPVYRALAEHVAEHGGEVVSAEQQRIEGRRARALWWLDGVAAVTDGASLLADDGIEAAADWLFAIGRPDLVIADQCFAGAASASGHETVAFADFDSVALGVAARRGRPLLVVPLQHGRPPAAYGVVVEQLTGPTLEREAESHNTPESGRPHLAPDTQGSQSTT